MGAGKFPAHSEENFEQDLIARLRTLPGKPSPDPGFRAELRTQLVAIAPRLVAAANEDLGITQKKSSHRHRKPVRGFAALRRPLLAVGGAAAVLVLLLGLAVHISGGALPGQSLYGLKRASEDFKLSIDGGSDSAKGLQYLKLASSRANESTKLLDARPASDSDASLVASTLRTADSETRSGMQLLGSAALSTRSANPISPIQDWARGQSAAISALLPDLPAGSAKTQANTSIALLQQVVARVDEWKQDFNKGCLTVTNSDALGPKGC